jgi:hypothetical protein
VGRNEPDRYARKADRVEIYHTDEVLVAVIEVVSPGNKATGDDLLSFSQRAIRFLRAGVHLLIVDLFPPGHRDSQGIHKVIWDRLRGGPCTLPVDGPLTLSAYSAGMEVNAYVDSVAVGDPLPDMPIFLTEQHYVPCPLEATYQTAWSQFPAVLKGPLETPPAS